MLENTLVAQVHVLATPKLSPADHINQLFKNEAGVYSILKTEEDIVKANRWFGAEPQFYGIISYLREETDSFEL
jgi:hypothetical protein